MGDRLSTFGFLSLGFSHIFSASLQTYMLIGDEDHITSDILEIVPFIRFHQSLIEYMFSTGTEDDIPFALSTGSAAMVTATLRSSVIHCRGDISFSLDPALIGICSAGFAETLAEELMLFLGISGSALPSITENMPFYPPLPERVLLLEGKRGRTEYRCSITTSGASYGPASGHRAEFSFPLISESGA